VIHRRLGNERRVAAVLQTLGHVNAELGEWREARSILEESLEIGRRSGDETSIAHSLCALGLAHLIRDDFSPARALLEESLPKFRKLDDKFWIGGCLYFLGYIDCEEGEYSAARSRFLQMNEAMPPVQFPFSATYTLEGFARLAAAEGQADRALKLGGATAASRLTFRGSIGPAREATFARGLKPAWEALGEEEGKAAFDEGRAMTLEQAVEYALDTEEAASASPKDTTASLLSAREVEVLRLVAEGLTDAQVARRLYLSPRTVGQHLRSIYRKLGVPSRAAAAREALQRGLM
jgi:DNA-binding CsgD family transcriptional regulator